MNRQRWVRATVASVVATVLLALGLASPAQADSEIDGAVSQFQWNGNASFPFCFGAHPGSTTIEDCDAITLGEISFNVKMTLNGSQVTVTTDWRVVEGYQTIRMFSMLECRKDERIDDSCGYIVDGRAYEDYGYWGSWTDQFYLGDEEGNVRNGKFFFNLHYRASVQGYPTGPDDDLMEIFLGTTHRIKCNKKWSYSCEMA